jgi:hypothetical protein
MTAGSMCSTRAEKRPTDEIKLTETFTPENH